MTNREKAEEIMPLIQNMELICEDTRLRLVHMAKWKDEQFIKFLENHLGDDVTFGLIEKFKEFIKK